MEHKQVFEIIGYFDEYWVDGKYIGVKRKSSPDGLKMGYGSKLECILDMDIKLDNNKIIKKGTAVKKYQNPLCGKRIKN